MAALMPLIMFGSGFGCALYEYVPDKYRVPGKEYNTFIWSFAKGSVIGGSAPIWIPLYISYKIIDTVKQ